MKNYDTFKQYMKRLAGEYKKDPHSKQSVIWFIDWLVMLPEPEKKEEKKWKPTHGEKYYYPFFIYNSMISYTSWTGTDTDIYMFQNGLVCKTKEEAIALAERMLEAIKN